MKYALIGEKLGHSYSKTIHEKYFRIKNIHSSYDLIEIEKSNLNCKIDNMKSDGFSGCNVTIPYKTDVMNICSYLSPEAERIGSVNTLVFKNGIVSGYNTDYHGLRLALEYNSVSVKGKDVVILGTGGASKACQVLCSDLLCKSITLVSRHPSDTEKHETVSYECVPSADIVINTTPVGMYPNAENSPFDNFENFTTAVDLIYNPAMTLFLQKAQKSGLKAVNGLYMLVAQAMYSQSIWNNTDVDFEAIDSIYNEMRGESK